MINELKDRIFTIVIIFLSIITIGIIVTFYSIAYNNVLNTSTNMLDRMMELGPKKNGEIEDFDRKPEFEMDGVYRVAIENSRVDQNTNIPKEINELALEIANKGKEKGIIGEYIYDVKTIDKSTCIISMINDEPTIYRLYSMSVFSILILIITLILIYFISKKLANMITKPVEDNFEKQKQFISDASHELKTPLAVIEANADVLKDSLDEDNKWIRYIQNETESMNKLINDLLLLSKTENIDVSKEREKIDVSKEVEIIYSMFESMAYEKKINMSSNIESGIVLNCTKGDIEHIVSTLLDNAIKHTKEENKVCLELREENGNVILTIKNQGEEIPINEREKIFERFYRIDKSRNRNEKRYGLGLAIAKSIVEKYLGKIIVDCKDGYTIFTVLIPFRNKG